MKKILAVIDAVNYKADQLDAIKHVAGMRPFDLTIVMMEDISVMPLMAPDFAQGVPGHYYEIVIKAAEERGRIVKENTAVLQKDCKEKNITYTLHSDKGAAAERIILESRFADLLLISKELSFAFLFDSTPSSFVKNVLANAQCPVMVISQDISTIQGVIFTYNGSYSSMFAIKSFISVFPILAAREAIVVYVCEKENSSMPHETLLKEYLANHSKNVSYRVFSGNADDILQAYLTEKQNYITTFGAYGRSRLSRFFNSSSARNILNVMKGPLFITHP